MAKKRRKKGAFIAKAAGLYLLRRSIVNREKEKAARRIAAGKPALSAIAGPSIGRILYKSLGGRKLPVKAVIAASVQKKIRKKVRKKAGKALFKKAFVLLGAKALQKKKHPGA